MLARAAAGVAGWGLGLEPAIVRTRRAVNTGARYACVSDVFINADASQGQTRMYGLIALLAW